MANTRTSNDYCRVSLWLALSGFLLSASLGCGSRPSNEGAQSAKASAMEGGDSASSATAPNTTADVTGTGAAPPAATIVATDPAAVANDPAMAAADSGIQNNTPAVAAPSPDPANTQAAIAPRTTTPAVASNASPSAEVAAPEVINVAPLEGVPSATSFAMTEDGKYVVFTHHMENKITIYDVAAGAVAQTLETPVPRTAICRDGEIFVANYGHGTISVFADAPNWKLSNQLKVQHPNIVHLSAPRGEHYRDHLLVTCHLPPEAPSTHKCYIHDIDVKKDQDVASRAEFLGSMSYDGKVLVSQQSFKSSPGGGIQVFLSGGFFQPGGFLFRNLGSFPHLRQEFPGTFWMSNQEVFFGNELQNKKGIPNAIFAADYTQPILYSLTKDSLTAMHPDERLEKFAEKPIEFATPFDDRKFSEHITNDTQRRRKYVLDSPLACTLGNDLHLFLIDLQTSGVYHGVGNAFTAPSEGGGRRPASLAETNEPITTDSLGVPFVSKVDESISAQLQGPEGAQFTLMNGPDGMKLSQDGTLEWTPGEKMLGEHELKIRMSVDSDISFHRPKIEIVRELGVASSPSNAARGADAAGLYNGPRAMLEDGEVFWTYGRGVKSILLLQGQKLRRINPDGITIGHVYDLPDTYAKIEERERTFVAVSAQAKRLDVIDKTTLKVLREVALTSTDVKVLEISDLAIHPTESTSYVAVKHDQQIPRYRVLEINERSGDITAPENFIGSWVRVGPRGRNVICGYRDIYERGSSFHINPGFRIIETPKYGNIDWLIRYSTSRGRVSRMEEVITQAGINGRGITISPDGNRVTYLSIVGNSGNMAGFDTRDLTKAVPYEMHRRGNTRFVAYHPVLPWVASSGDWPVVVLNRETGELLEDKVEMPRAGMQGAKVQNMKFAPDGQSLIFLCADTNGRYLRQMPLRLTSAEARIASTGVKAPAPRSSAPKITVKKAQLESLSAPKAPEQEVTVAQIAKHFMPSVVLIMSGDAASTGFVVGKQGYALTSAHGLIEDDVKVAYMRLNGDEKLIATTAEIVEIDDERDLALIKIKTPVEMRPVLLAKADEINTGEKVCVIGNPGVGGAVLSHTVTTGIVSNRRRMIDDHPFIQMSAAINPGNSGGPMFDYHGRVIGLVALKAKIEGAGFAIPASALRKFLNELATEE